MTCASPAMDRPARERRKTSPWPYSKMSASRPEAKSGPGASFTGFTVSAGSPVSSCRTAGERPARGIPAPFDGTEYRRAGQELMDSLDGEPFAVGWESGDMGTVVMLGILLGLIVLIFGLVLRYDPEARHVQSQERHR